MSIKTEDDFKKFVEEASSKDGYKRALGFGIARVDFGQKNEDKVLQATYPIINWQENYASATVFIEALKNSGIDVDFSGSEFVADLSKEFATKALEIFTPYIDDAIGDAHKNIQVVKHLEQMVDEDNYRVCFIFEDDAPHSVEAVYLKLQALSTAKAKLRSLNLNGAFGLLSNVAWSGNTPIELDWLRDNEIELKMIGEYPYIDSVDKFPRYLQHIIPADNTRVLDTSKVRFGAQLAGGTTVMPGASYINFNAGTLGAVMVEGRISSSAIVGAGSDVGGGASILGVLSGTDGNPISIGENTLLGANSTTGIPLGDGCIVDAGLSILAGTKITITDEEIAKIIAVNKDAKITNTIKAEKLQSLNGIHFRADSISGQIQARRSTREIKLNKELH
jgi:2,3,4,5-tetrahydropyridine-2-carboxylate N-succinyltransferase